MKILPMGGSDGMGPHGSRFVVARPTSSPPSMNGFAPAMNIMWMRPAAISGATADSPR
jgi:hypothetical protein